MKILRDKIKNLANISVICFSLIVNSFIAFGQQHAVNKYGLVVINSEKQYLSQVKSNADFAMIDLKKIVPGIVLDLRYASTNNFVGKAMYPENTVTTFLRLPAAMSLLQVQQELNQKGFGLKIYDAYRPYQVTEKFWELIHDERYVADPSKGSGHNRGIAVDLTLIELSTSQELKMPTGFDNFSDTAHHAFVALPEVQLENRKLLKETMERHGFMMFDTEWWHYSYKSTTEFPVLDLTFSKLAKANEKFKRSL